MTLLDLRPGLFPLLLAGGLLVPGWMIGRALGAPAGPVGAFLGSAALLLNLVLFMDVVGLDLHAPQLAAGLALVCAGLLAVRWKTSRRSSAAINVPPASIEAPAAPQTRAPGRLAYWLLLPASLGFAAIMVRAGFEPLSGYDNPFRWDFLARQIFKEGDLSFYPPVTAEDFTHYGWCDGIPPLISCLYLWTYCSLGHVAASATTPVVATQAALIFWTVWRLAARRGGPAAGAAAVGLLATSAGFLWGTAMGQETGLTALCTLAMFSFIEQARDQPTRRWLIWAGLAAGTGALAREYGLALIPLGALALVWWRTPRRGWLQFCLTAAAVALPWYLRNWLKTGHPLYSLGTGELFPANPIHLEYMRIVAAEKSIGGQLSSAVPLLAKLVALVAGVPFVFGCVTGFARWRSFLPWLAAAAAFGALWLGSIAHTSGGYTYSTRVLTPAIALMAVVGGVGIAGWATSRRSWLVVAGMTVLALDAAGRSLFLPANVQASWWHEPSLVWHRRENKIERSRENINWAAIADAAAGRKILVTDPLFHARLVEIGATPVPLFSPAVRFLFGPDSDFETDLRRLRSAGFRFILISHTNSFILDQLAPHRFFSNLRQTTPVAVTNVYVVYDLYPRSALLSETGTASPQEQPTSNRATP